jgi:hypothetical protein
MLLMAVPLIGFVFFVTGQFINLFGMFAWGAWGEEQGVRIQMQTFNPFRNTAHFVARVGEVLPVWQAAVLACLEAVLTLTALRAPRAAAGERFIRLFDAFNRQIFVNHFAVLIGAALSAFLGGSRAILLALLGLLFAIDLIGLVRALRAPAPRG